MRRDTTIVEHRIAYLAITLAVIALSGCAGAVAHFEARTPDAVYFQARQGTGDEILNISNVGSTDLPTRRATVDEIFNVGEVDTNHVSMRRAGVDQILNIGHLGPEDLLNDSDSGEGRIPGRTRKGEAAAAGTTQHAKSSIGKPPRMPDVSYEPSPEAVVSSMLELAKVGPDDLVYDLGCGDGRIVVMAAKKYGARGVGIDIDPDRIAEANENARHASVIDKVGFIEGDLFDTDLSPATVITMFLSPQVNMKLRAKLQALKAGTRIVSYMHNLGDWQPQAMVGVIGLRGRSAVYLWVVP